ncbi:hypothetical protein FRC20_001961 [Serendipita sp. 405]|nr:hypothetical protein FRC20_001961 [Serendipita sp. 405]
MNGMKCGEIRAIPLVRVPLVRLIWLHYCGEIPGRSSVLRLDSPTPRWLFGLYQVQAPIYFSYNEMSTSEQVPTLENGSGSGGTHQQNKSVPLSNKNMSYVGGMIAQSLSKVKTSQMTSFVRYSCCV